MAKEKRVAVVTGVVRTQGSRRGGETHDAMFIHLPDLGVMFVGDFIMPYLGRAVRPGGRPARPVTSDRHPGAGESPLSAPRPRATDAEFRLCRHASATQRRSGVTSRPGAERDAPG